MNTEQLASESTRAITLPDIAWKSLDSVVEESGLSLDHIIGLASGIGIFQLSDTIQASTDTDDFVARHRALMIDIIKQYGGALRE